VESSVPDPAAGLAPVEEGPAALEEPVGAVGLPRGRVPAALRIADELRQAYALQAVL
jgi:hypothetical protein